MIPSRNNDPGSCVMICSDVNCNDFVPLRTWINVEGNILLSQCFELPYLNSSESKYAKICGRKCLHFPFDGDSILVPSSISVEKGFRCEKSGAHEMHKLLERITIALCSHLNGAQSRLNGLKG